MSRAHSSFSSLRPTLAASLLALPLILSPVSAAPPDAGSLLESLKPAPGLPPRPAGSLPEAPARPAIHPDSTVRIVVKAFRVSGARVFPEGELLALLDDAIGKELSLAEINDLAQRITRRYHEAGYLLARTYLPAQEIKDGIVEIAVLEGRLGKLRVENTSRLAAAAVAARLSALQEGQAVDGKALERSLLLLNDLPGVEVGATLKPGTSVGTSDLDVRLTPRARVGGSVELDNYGNRYTGDLRLGVSFSAGNLSGLGDLLSLRALDSEGMDYGRVAWQVPVGYAGTQAGAAWSDMRYALRKDFAALQAHGTADVASLYLIHPLQRSRVANLSLQLNYDRKRLQDRVDATGSISDKTLDVWSLNLAGDRVDGLGGGGFNTGSLALTSGRLDMDGASALLDSVGHGTRGSYAKGTLALTRLQSLTNALTLYGSLQLQRAGKNLDSSEKMSLGGAQAVRAYPQGEAPADDAWLTSLELRHAFAPDWQAMLFLDAAQGALNHSPIPADGNNRRHLAGAGLGLAYSRLGDLSLQLGLAWRDGARPTSDVDRGPRAWIQAAKRF